MLTNEEADQIIHRYEKLHHQAYTLKNAQTERSALSFLTQEEQAELEVLEKKLEEHYQATRKLRRERKAEAIVTIVEVCRLTYRPLNKEVVLDILRHWPDWKERLGTAAVVESIDWDNPGIKDLIFDVLGENQEGK